MDADAMRRVIVDTAKQLEVIAAELQAALEGEHIPNVCGCVALNIERDTVTNKIVVVCNKGRRTEVDVDQAKLMLINNDEVIEYIAQRVAADHQLDAGTIAFKLRNIVGRRDATSRINLEG